jgi:hypothetical protein
MEAPDAPAEKRRFNAVALAIIVSVSVAVAYGYYRTVDRPNLEPRLELHERIMNGTAEAPYRYRVLVPAVCEALRRMLGVAMSRDAAFLLSYALYDLGAVILFLWLLFAYLRGWFPRERALIGVLFAAAAMPVALRDHYFQPWSLLEAALFTAGLVCIYRRRLLLLAAVTALASLNRETAVFIPVAFLVANTGARGGLNGDRPDGRRTALLFAGYAAIWAAAFFGLRAALGSAPDVITLSEIFARNTTAGGLMRSALRAAALFGAFWIFAVAGFRRAPRFARRMALVAIPYVAAILVWGVWYEVRLLLPLYAIVLPLGLGVLGSGREEPSAARS